MSDVLQEGQHPAIAAAPSAGSAGRDGEFETLLSAVLDRAFGAALHLTLNRQDAEDLVQETCLHAYRAFGSFESGTNFRAWFFKILMNCFYTSRRRQRPQSSLQDLEDSYQLYLYVRSGEVGLHEHATDPAKLTLDRLASDDIAAALDALPDEYRAVCTLYFIEDLSYQQIAEALGVPVGTVRSRLHRGRRMLQKRLWALAEDQGILPTHPMGAKEGA